jgi:rare lipoprotein A (peptidoglycan hydrolase)
MRSPSLSSYCRYIALLGATLAGLVVQGATATAEAYEKVGRPYKINGRWYEPRVDALYDRHGTASWYGIRFHGRKTANGERFNMHALSAAHPTMPLPSYAYVTNKRNGRTVLVRVNDRGPYAGNRLIDLSREVARLLGFIDAGVAPVRVTYAGKAPVKGGDRKEREFLQTQAWYTGKTPTTAVARAPVPKTEPAKPQIVVAQTEPVAKKPVESNIVAVAKAPEPALAALDKGPARQILAALATKQIAGAARSKATEATFTPAADKESAALVHKLETEAVTQVMAKWRLAQRTMSTRKAIR